MKKALLIGGAGFIGHHLGLALQKNNFQVTITDGLQVNNLISLQDSRVEFSHRAFYIQTLEERLNLLRTAQIPIYVEDARDYVRLNRIVNQIKPDVIFLLAAVSHASRANKDPYSTFDHSFRTLENTLDVIKSQENKPQLIFFSSSMVYGNFNSKIPNEDFYCDPKNIYGALKLGGEKLALAYSNVFGFPVTIVRPSALYGPRCVSRRVLQVFIENALCGNELIIQGDGSDSLDFTFIEDLVSGLVSLTLNEKSYNEVFNLTAGNGRRILDAAKIISNYFPNVKIKFIDKDQMNPERGSLDITKAKNTLNYEPKYDLETGLKKYISWYQSSWKTNKINNNTIEVNE